MISFTLKEIAELTSSRIIGNPEYIISGISALEGATNKDLSFFEPPKYLQNRFQKAMETTQAGAILIRESDYKENNSRNYLLHTHPSQAFQVIINHIRSSRPVQSAFDSIHSTAVIHESVTLGKNVTIQPYVVIDHGTTIGDNTTIGAGSFIGSNVSIGDDCYIHPHVTIREETRLKNRVIIQSGSVIGSCGFGYTTSKEGKHEKLLQVGYVLIEDDVEVGANTTIDRARFGLTRVQQGTKVDNLVQVAHGVTIGEHCLIVSQVGIAGSAEIGNHCVLAGQSGVVGHLKVPAQTILAARGAFSKTFTKGGQYGGAPAVPIKNYRLQEVHIKNLDKYVNRIKDLEKRLDIVESE